MKTDNEAVQQQKEIKMLPWKAYARSVLGVILGTGLTSAAAAVEIQFEVDKVLVSGLHAGNRIALLATTRQFDDLTMSQRNLWQVITDSDSDGDAVYDFGKPIPEASIWAAVEIESGDTAIASPAAEELKIVAFPSGGLSNQSGSSSTDLLTYPADTLLALWVRPGAGGSFLLSSADGGSQDFDGLQDAVSSVRAEDASPMTLSVSVPTSFSTGDVLVVLDPTTFEISTTSVQ